ncbi:MAG TPA: ClbS/DfsB family four-helix bundle protein [Thermomicrobiales bacterium]|nr:ClbS/DfsB family four-helix bundle protein [Thermomicrobiales bacterium]
MSHMGDRDTLLAYVRTLRDEVEQITAEAGQDGDQRFDDPGGWTFKDIIAHLTGWRLLTAARLEAGLSGGEPAKPWPGSLDEDADLDEINRWFYEANRDKSFAEIKRESHETFDRVERAIAALPERDLLEVDRFPWLQGHALGPAVLQGTLEHYREHEPDLRARLTTKDHPA